MNLMDQRAGKQPRQDLRSALKDLTLTTDSRSLFDMCLVYLGSRAFMGTPWLVRERLKTGKFDSPATWPRIRR